MELRAVRGAIFLADIRPSFHAIGIGGLAAPYYAECQADCWQYLRLWPDLISSLGPAAVLSHGLLRSLVPVRFITS
jgi:hypothetical protein